jgi:DNA-binding SARP family transcriptional activator/tetratricopeptide (TPR) repeat protein
MALQITLTGQLAAEADGTRADATDLPGRQASVVFAYLVAERDRPVPAEELAEAVWGGTLPATWRPALRGVVSKVRGFLDLVGVPAADALTSAAGCYRLDLPDDTAVDLELADGETDAARRALDAGRLGEALASAQRARAIAGRPLLPGHDGAWIEDRRAALHQVRLRSLELLADIHLAGGQAALAVGPAGDLVALEPFRDSAYRRLLAAHAAAGDRGEALRAYDRYRRMLADELGVGPSPELEAAYLELLHAEPAAGAAAARTAGGRPPPDPAPAAGVFFGRGRELRRLQAAWADARAGRRRTVLVAGEAGIGKTRLVAELAALAEADGAVVLAGRCDQHLGVPHLPLREAVGRHLAGYPAERLRSLLGPRAAELVRFWPELAWRLPALPAPTATGAEADPFLLFEALTWLLEAIAVTGPLLLVVDDLHGADEATLLLLGSLAQARRPARLLTVLTYRDDERRPRAGLAAALGDLVRAPGAELLTLGGLDTDEVAAMAAATTARPLGQEGQALAHVLRERTAGNPYLVTELLRHLVETGALGGDVAEAAAGPAVDDLPESLRWVVAQRMARLGGPVEHVVGVAAVVGYEAEVALLGRVAGLGHDSLVAALDTAVAARLLEERPGAPGRYGFRHPIVRDLLYRRLTAGERARLHRRVGQALEDLTVDTGRLGELADHFALAGSPFADRAVGYARRAGEMAFAEHRYEEAASRHRQALALLERELGAGADPDRHQELLLAEGDAWSAAGQTGQATEAYLRAAAAARSAGSAAGLARAALGLGDPVGFWSVELPRAVPTGLLAEALEAVGPGNSPARALLLARLAGWRAAGARLEDEAARPPSFGEAVAMARRIGDPRTLARVLADQEVALDGVLRPGGPEDALADSAELDHLTVGLGDDVLAFQAGRARAGALLTAGDLDGVDRLAGRHARIARERHAPHHRWLSLRLLAGMAMLRGDFGDSERLAAEALTSGGRPLGPAASMAHGAHLVFLRWLQGRPDEVGALLDRLAAQQPWGAGGWRRLLPLAGAGQARPADDDPWPPAAGAADGLDGRARVTALVAAVGACARLGDARLAARLSERLAPWSGRHLAAGQLYLGAADHHLGILAATAGRWEESLGHLRAALAASERLGARPWRALSTQAYAAALRGRDGPGDRGRAAALDGLAHRAAGPLGMELPGWGRPELGPRPPNSVT